MNRVLFVCLGNICRSPSAEGIFRKIVQAKGFEDAFEIDSAGTGDWHIGHTPDQRAQQAASRRDVDLSALRARQLSIEDIIYYDLILVMDRRNRADVVSLAQPEHEHKICYLLEYSEQYDGLEIPDPYYGGTHGFDLVLDMIEDSCKRLLNSIIE
ncbi:MAG: low molecular weight phosphotyrosine protein phosphatase [Gammaproteobacteria bacterium]|nr:low molecular weight phosphotyrosine protein phosphatase [Gammaproteobacteria bacterium]